MSQSPSLAAPPAAPALAGQLPLLVVLAGTFITVLDQFMVNVALPAMQRDLRLAPSAVQWVVTGNGLTMAAGLITGGRLGDLFGRRRLFMLGLALFALASIACAAAPNGRVLVAARILQGLASALALPQVLAIIGVAYTGPARTQAFAAFGIALGLASTLGQLVGGALMHLDPGGLGWRACFLVNLPISTAALLLARRVLAPFDARAPAGGRLDMGGVLLMGAVFAALALPLVEGRQAGWPAWAWCSLAGAVGLLALFAWQQRRRQASGRDPLIHPPLLADRRFVAGLFTVLAFYGGNAAHFFVLAMFLQRGLLLPPLVSGVVFTAVTVGFFFTSMAAPRLAAHFQGAPIAGSALLLALAHALQGLNLAFTPDAWLLAAMVPLLLLQGGALGLVMAPLSGAVLAGLPAQHAGVASGVLSTLQHAGNALGVALVGLVFYGVLDRGQGYVAAYGGSLVYLIVSSLAVALLYQRVMALSVPAR